MRDIADVERYVRALETLRREGLPAAHAALLQQHWKARRHTATWAELAHKLGYPTADAVNREYETLAARVGGLLGLAAPPLSAESAEPAWIVVLVFLSNKKGPRGHRAYILRRNVIEAMERVGLVSADEPHPG